MFKNINILKIFFDEPTKQFNVREISRLTSISPATASKKLKELAGRKILKEEIMRNFIFYKADMDSEKYRDFKLFFIIRQIKEIGLVEALNKFYLKPAIILYGSTRYGLDTETSDIDLAIISEKTERFDKLKPFEKKLHRSIHLLPVKSIDSTKNEHLTINLMKGFLIQGEWSLKSVSKRE